MSRRNDRSEAASPGSPEGVVDASPRGEAAPLAGAEPRAPTSIVANVNMLEPRNLARALRARNDFENDVETGEGILQELVAGEVGIALQLLDVEAALASLLAKTFTDPRLASEVASVFRATTGLSAAVRKRIENSLDGAARLRAQRILLEQRRPRDV